MPQVNKIKSSQTTKYSFLKIMTGSDLSSRRLPLMEVKSREPGPVVWLTGCVHGDEVGGMVVIQEIFKRLRKAPLLKGSLFAFPLMNPIGFETISRHIVLSKEDLNRSFPGNPEGSIAERIAHRIFSTIMETGPALVIDLHNDWIKSIPYVLIDPSAGPGGKEVYERVRYFAERSDFIMIGEPETSADMAELRKTITGSLIGRGVPALTLELGEAYVVNERNVEDGVRSVWNILSLLEMTLPVSGKLNYCMPEQFRGKMLRYCHRPVSSASGVIRFMVRPGELVKKGQKIARVYNVFGKLQQTLAATDDGIVLGCSDSSVSLPGLPVMAFGIPWEQGSNQPETGAGA